MPSVVGLAVSLAAVVVVFVPFAFDTSPLDAVMLTVPGNQGNWWHALVGAPFFLAFPMIWLRLRSLVSGQPLTPASYRIISVVAGLSICGTIAVEAPFLLHLAGTSEWQRVVILALGFGIIMATGATLYWRRGRMTPDRVGIIALITAYLANAALCLVVYSDATGTLKSRSGWVITMTIVWPMALELIGTYIDNFRKRGSPAFAEQ
ncbi:MAG: hypothetical protein JO145_16890 [Acidobacteriaceae bacterium]|nr:hypothetical protein [Acidobacteriaceae bacterium]